MKISALADASGVPLPTIKFYLREGLLQAGQARAVNQADYGEEHIRRLRLIRALTDVGGLRLREVRAVLAAIDDERLPLHELLGVAQYALAVGDGEGRPDSTADAANADVDRLLALMGWNVDRGAPARHSLAEAITTLRDLGWDVSADDLVQYARAVDDLAADEVASVPDRASRAQLVEHMVVGTVVFEAIVAALRHLAQEHHSARRFAS
jgi:DNA-binding transcriptional MerR regulator